jgi:ribosomal protein S18 acetylase RimI-like enzyme
VEGNVITAVPVVLREATEADRTFLFDVFARTMRRVIDDTWGWDERWQRANFSRRFVGYDVSVIEADGRSVGGLFLEHRPDTIYIHEIQILPEYQGRGIGGTVIRGVIERAAGRGVPVGLSVVPANPRAQRLYERLGFAVISVESPFIRMRSTSRHAALV